MSSCELNTHNWNPEAIPELKRILTNIIMLYTDEKINTSTLSKITGINPGTLSSWARRGLIPFYRIFNGGAVPVRNFSPDAAIKAICITILIKEQGNNGKGAWAVVGNQLVGNDWFNCKTATFVVETIITNLPTLSFPQKQSGRGRHRQRKAYGPG